MIDRFKDQLRDLAQQHQRREQDDRFKNCTEFSDPVYIDKRLRNWTVGIEYPERRLPMPGDVVELRLWGGKVYLMVDAAQMGDIEDTSHVMFITGQMLR